MTKKHEYKYTIIDKNGDTKTNRMKNTIYLFASKESTARRILKIMYPNCTIIELKTKSHHNYMMSNSPASGLIL